MSVVRDNYGRGFDVVVDGRPTLQGGDPGILGILRPEWSECSAVVGGPDLHSVVLAPGELERIAALVGVEVDPDERVTKDRIHAAIGPRAGECRHGIAGAWADATICSGCVAEIRAMQDQTMRERIGGAVLDALAPHRDDRGRVPYTEDTREAVVTAVVGALGDDLAPVVEVTITLSDPIVAPTVERIATVPRERGEAWGDYAARRGQLRADFPAGSEGDRAWLTHLAWLAGEPEPT